MRPELVAPTTRLHAAFLACRADWGPGLHEDGFGLDDRHDPDSTAGFAAWVEERRRLDHPAGTPCPATPHATSRWIVEDGRVLGAITLRHLHDEERGDLGYGVRPSARRRGLGTWALGEMLDVARAVLDVDRVLLCCLADNVGSARTIQRCGGVLEGVRETGHGPLQRWWITL